MNVIIRTVVCILPMLIMTGFTGSALGQDVQIPDPGLNAAVRETLQKPTGPLTQQDLLGLTNLVATSRNITNLLGLTNARNLTNLELQSNHLANLTFINGLTKLRDLNLSFNALDRLVLPGDMTNLISLELFADQLTNLVVPAGLQKLIGIDLEDNRLANLNLPANLTNLNFLILSGNQFTNLTLPAGLTALTELYLVANQLVTFALPADVTNLIVIKLQLNQLTNLTLHGDLRQLAILDLHSNRFTNYRLPANLNRLGSFSMGANQLTNLFLPPGLTNLSFLSLGGNQLANFNLPAGLSQLTSLQLDANPLANLTLPPDMTRLDSLFLNSTPIETLVLSEFQAATNLAPLVGSLRNQGVSVFTYPLSARLSQAQQSAGALRFALSGPPGIYSILSSTNLATWSPLGATTNQLGKILFADTTAHLSPNKYYRALLQVPPANMVFIPANTFKMGGPTNDPSRTIFEGPQATVTLTRGYWIGKYEVTQGEYLAVTGDNPSNFPGDPSRAVSSVTWFDATNYCAKLTQRELAAGRIPADSHYRLPTEAEWECAARAGTSTQFSYGDDVNFNSLTNYAWILDFANVDLTVHPGGQKLPNPWGLYDMSGNVWEWCEDWYGDQSGGVQTDPTGPISNPNGNKVMRGGAYDYTGEFCRSAARLFIPVNHPDSDLGFRVVLATGP